MVTLLPVMLAPPPASAPKLPTTTSRTPSPVTSASPTQDGLLLNVDNGVPTRDRLPIPSFWNTDTLPVFCLFALVTTTSGQLSPLISAMLTKLTFVPPVLSWILLNP